MLISRQWVSLPGQETLGTRRPCSGEMAHGLTSAALHALLYRGRLCAVHHVDGEVQLDWTSNASIPAYALEPVRVVCELGPRAAALAVAFLYRADAGASVVASLYAFGGALRDSVTFTAQTLPGTGEVLEAVYGTLTRYSQSIAFTGDTVRPGGGVGMRPLNVNAADVNGVCEVELQTAGGCEILAVAVYELAQDVVAP